MTARSDDPDASPEKTAAAAGGEIWGTWEELLLAAAVKRHGTGSWDSVAMEMQSRCPSAAARLTPTGCRLRFRHLHRRFAAGAENGGDDEDPSAANADEWVEKLRELRVAELRREVERHDVSIGSLQSEVKRLKEERERSISGEAAPAVKEDEEAEDEEPTLVKGSPEDDDLAGEDRVSGDESGRSCKESNSSDLKRPEHDAGTASGAVDGHAAGMDKEEAAAGDSVSVKPEAEPSGESVAGSKEAQAEKESSDVQSSASRREREGSGGEEAEAEAGEASPSSSAPAALPAAEVEALAAFLESVRSSKPGSVFERRLESQDNANYRSIIRRHVDLETIRSKLEPGRARYSSASEFYRDLLLLCANALVFFPRGSPEHTAAVQTRALVSKHMSASLRKDQPVTSVKPPKKPKADADVGSLLEKTAPIIVCRKRSSITKAAAAATKVEKVEKEETDEEEEKENEVKKATTKDKAPRGLRTNKSRGGLARKAGPNQRAAKDSESESAAAEGTKKADKKDGSGSGSSAAAGGVAKKRNAVNFLNRMKQNSAPSTERGLLLKTLKVSAAAAEQKAGKGEGRKEAGSGSKRDKDTPPGRRIGRPPKRAAAPPTPPPSKRGKGSGKRGGKK